MADFINKKLGRPAAKKEGAEGDAVALTPETFDAAVKGRKAFVKFYGRRAVYIFFACFFLFFLLVFYI
jgi:hypothetical protein